MVEVSEKEIQQLAEPLKKYLEENYDPHCSIVVSMDAVKIVRIEAQLLLTPQS